MNTLDLCEKYFGSRDLYEVFQIEKTALMKDIKKSYYKLSLQVHPDRCEPSEKEIATEKFKILSKLYEILSDKDKRSIYDQQGIVDDGDDMDSKLFSWLDLWRKIFKPLTEEDISNYEKSYVNSELERTDIKKAYLAGKGCINYIMDGVPFLSVDDEPRIKEIVGEMIAANEVPEYKIFTKEPEQKRRRRHRKLERQSKEAEKLKKEFMPQLLERQKRRESEFANMMDSLIHKYGGEKKKTPLKIKAKPDSKLKSVKNGKVKKNK